MRKQTEFETALFAGFSDGVFAIAITFLVLELKSPDDLNGDLATAFITVAPKLETWAPSFMIIGSLWVIQHNILAQLRATNTILLYLNLLFLMCISLTPLDDILDRQIRPRTVGDYHLFRFDWVIRAGALVSLELCLPQEAFGCGESR